MNLKEMTIEEMEKRKIEISAEVDTEGADLDALTEEVRAINAEIEERKQAESKRAEIRTAVATGDGVVIETPVKEERTTKTMKIEEVRNSKEYIDAFAEYIKTGDDTELRTVYPLLSDTTGVGGTIAVPDFVYDIVKTAWDNSQIMSLVERVNIPGNLKVNFEIAGDPATIHVEGSGAVDEEDLTEGIVTIIPRYAKKWKSFSNEVFSLRGEDFLRYLYDEITYRIVKAIEDSLVDMIANLPAVATSTSPSAATIKTAPGLDTVATAIGNLSDEATNPVVVMNKLTWATFKAVQYAAQFPVDPFEGLRVIFNNSLPAYSSASEDDVYMIVGDFRQGALANFPNGNDVEFTFDELTRKKEDLIEVLGKLYCGVAPVACGAFALVTVPASA